MQLKHYSNLLLPAYHCSKRVKPFAYVLLVFVHCFVCAPLNCLFSLYAICLFVFFRNRYADTSGRSKRSQRSSCIRGSSDRIGPDATNRHAVFHAVEYVRSNTVSCHLHSLAQHLRLIGWARNNIIIYSLFIFEISISRFFCAKGCPTLNPKL